MLHGNTLPIACSASQFNVIKRKLAYIQGMKMRHTSQDIALVQKILIQTFLEKSHNFFYF